MPELFLFIFKNLHLLHLYFLQLDVGKINFSIGGYAYVTDGDTEYDLSQTYSSSEFQFEVSRQASSNIQPLLLWNKCLLLSIASIIFMYISNRIISNNTAQEIKLLSLFDLLRLINGMTILRLPKSMWLRTLLLVIMANFCLIRNFYQGFLYKLLTDKKAEVIVDTIAEMIKLNYTFYAPKEADIVFKYASKAFRNQ